MAKKKDKKDAYLERMKAEYGDDFHIRTYKRWKINNLSKLGISFKMYNSYVQNVKKARAKYFRNVANAELLRNIKTSWRRTPTSKNELIKRVQTNERFLERNFRRKENELVRQEFAYNVKSVFGTLTGEKIVERFEYLSDKQFKEFWSKNGDIEGLVYASPKTLEKELEKLGIEGEQILSRVNRFIKERGY